MKKAVVLIIYKRGEYLDQIFDSIKKYKPSNLYIIADGPKNIEEKLLCDNAREKANKLVSWPCKTTKIYSNKHLGLRSRVVSGLNQVFELESSAIILEDDLLIDPSFFRFATQLLDKYKNNKSILSISGTNFLYKQYIPDNSYYFSQYPHSWGWATWRRAWQLFDNNMDSWEDLKNSQKMKGLIPDKIERLFWTMIFDRLKSDYYDSWAYRWTYTHIINGKLSITPSVNLVSNLGHDIYATHTKRNDNLMGIEKQRMKFPMKHPRKITPNLEADRITANHSYISFTTRLSLLIKNIFRIPIK